MKKFRFKESDLVRHKETKKLGYVVKQHTYKELKVNGHRFIYPDNYYTIWWGNENINPSVVLYSNLDVKSDTTCIGELKLIKPKK